MSFKDHHMCTASSLSWELESQFCHTCLRILSFTLHLQNPSVLVRILEHMPRSNHCNIKTQKITFIIAESSCVFIMVEDIGQNKRQRRSGKWIKSTFLHQQQLSRSFFSNSHHSEAEELWMCVNVWKQHQCSVHICSLDECKLARKDVLPS